MKDQNIKCSYCENKAFIRVGKKFLCKDHFVKLLEKINNTDPEDDAGVDILVGELSKRVMREVRNFIKHNAEKLADIFIVNVFKRDGTLIWNFLREGPIEITSQSELNMFIEDTVDNLDQLLPEFMWSQMLPFPNQFIKFIEMLRNNDPMVLIEYDPGWDLLVHFVPLFAKRLRAELPEDWQFVKVIIREQMFRLNERLNIWIDESKVLGFGRWNDIVRHSAPLDIKTVTIQKKKVQSVEGFTQTVYVADDTFFPVKHIDRILKNWGKPKEMKLLVKSGGNVLALLYDFGTFIFAHINFT